jgi:TPR repeat protein
MTRKVWVLLTTILGILLSSLACSEDISDAVKAREQGRFHDALEILIERSLDGDLHAIHEVGLTYAQMNDHASGAIWIKLSAERGLAKSQSMLGAMYMTGLGVPQDESLGIHWHKKAAEQGFRESQVAIYLIENVTGPSTDWECTTEDTEPAFLSVSEGHIVFMPMGGDTMILKRVDPVDPRWITGAADHVDQNFSIEIALDPETGRSIRQLVTIDTRAVAMHVEGTCVRLG